MERYLLSVYKVMFALSRKTREDVGVSAEELAALTTDECFKSADLDKDGRLSFDEFKKWYSTSDNGADADANGDVRNRGRRLAIPDLPDSLLVLAFTPEEVTRSSRYLQIKTASFRKRSTPTHSRSSLVT